MHTVCTGQTNYIVKVTQQWRHSYYRLWLHVVEVQRTGGGGGGAGRLLPMTAYFPIGRYMKDVPFPPKSVI